MIEGLRPYPELSATGIEWLPAVPAHWETRRVKTVLQEVDRRTSTGEEKLLSLRMIAGLVGHNEVGGRLIPPDALVGFKKIETGQIVMNRMRAASGLFGVADEPGLVSPDYAVFSELVDADRQYLLRLFKTPAMSAIFRSESKGLGTGQSGFLRLYTDRFGAIRIPLPSADEQQLIVRFLDWHGAMTGKLIRAKRRLIALLNEQKQSIIHRAVTRGLDPAAKLKPSGNQLIGDVVDCWDIRRLRNVAELRVSNVDKKVHEDELPVRLCNYIDVYRNEQISPAIPFMKATATPFEIERFRLKVGDVIITKDSENWKDIGVPSLVATEADDLVCAYHLAMLRPIRGKIDGPFLFWQLMGWAVRWSFALQASGVTRFGLSQGAIKALQLVVPPLGEQQKIVAHLVEATADITRGVQDASDEIALILEFRNRLIADVVTGQLDVRAVAASLPNVDEAEAEANFKDGDDLDDDADAFAEEEAA